MKGEKLIWEGKPQYKARWAFLEIFGGGAETGPYMAVLPVGLILIVIALIKAINTGEYLFICLWTIALFLLLFGAEFHKMIRRKNTKYVVSDQKVSIHDFWYGVKSKNEIELSNISSFYLENYKGNCGIIHIYVKEAKTFSTRNFWSGSQRALITFEDVANASEVIKILDENLKDFYKNS
ncbi:hypothetical protein N9B82_04585 [Saprospiraceae bacterium]|nr:hypothetical protein [Saprospiraceae bacterium]